MMREPVCLRSASPDGGRSVVLEDDGRVAYAYLLHDGAIVGDVWLYNVGNDPAAVDWRDRSNMPFENPARFCTKEILPRLTSATRASCRWFENGVEIAIGGLTWARLEEGSKPGWSRKAAVSGPLAKPLSTEQSK